MTMRSGLIHDIDEVVRGAWRRFASDYQHHQTGERIGDSHLESRCSFITEVLVPVTAGKLEFRTMRSASFMRSSMGSAKKRLPSSLR